MSKFSYIYDDVVWGLEIPKKDSIFSSGSLIVRGILEVLQGVRGKVLDLGCGGGQFSRALKFYRPDLEIIGIDVSKKAIKYAKKKSKNIKFLVGNAEDLPFKNQSFDALISIEVLEHIKNYQKVISEINRVLKPKGVIYISVSCEASVWTIPGILGRLGIDLTARTFGHINKLTYNEILNELKRKGFVITQKFYFGHFIRQIEDLLYAVYLAKTGKKPGDLWEEYKGNISIPNKIVFAIFKFAIFLTNIESKLFWWFPGISIQVVAKKK